MLRLGPNAPKAPSDPEAENRQASSQVKTSLLQFALTVVTLQLAPVVLQKLGFLEA